MLEFRDRKGRLRESVDSSSLSETHRFDDFLNRIVLMQCAQVLFRNYVGMSARRDSAGTLSPISFSHRNLPISKCHSSHRPTCRHWSLDASRLELLLELTTGHS